MLERPPRDERRRITVTGSREIEAALQNIGIRKSHAQYEVGPYKLERKSFDSGPTWADYLARHSDLPEAARVRIYLSECGSDAFLRRSVENAARRAAAVLGRFKPPGVVELSSTSPPGARLAPLISDYHPDTLKLDELAMPAREHWPADWLAARGNVSEILVLPEVDPRGRTRPEVLRRPSRNGSLWPRWRPAWPTSRAPAWSSVSRRAFSTPTESEKPSTPLQTDAKCDTPRRTARLVCPTGLLLVKGPVLQHCASGVASATTGVASAAIGKAGQDRARRVGRADLAVLRRASPLLR